MKKPEDGIRLFETSSLTPSLTRGLCEEHKVLISNIMTFAILN